MKNSIFFFLLISFDSLALEKVLVSYFRPYGRENKNHSEDVAKKLKEISKEIEIVLCPLSGLSTGLDVSFYSKRDDILNDNGAKGRLNGNTSSFEQLKECMNENPEVSSVYSIGEGLCEISYEGVAYNSMKTGSSSDMRDHNGNLIPFTYKIEKNGPTHIELNSEQNIAAYCYAVSLEENKFKFMSSLGSDPGNFVCNNLAYWMSHFIQENELLIDYEFIHIPPNFSRINTNFCSKNKIQWALKGPDFESNLTDYIANNIASFVKAKIKTKGLYGKASCKPKSNRTIRSLDQDVNSALLRECISTLKTELKEGIQQGLRSRKNLK